MTKKVVFYVLSFLFLVVFIDLGIGAFFHTLKHINEGYYYNKFFDYSDTYFQLIEKNKDAFKIFMDDYYDPVVGWNSPRSGHFVSQGCFEDWEAFYNDDGSRKTSNKWLEGKYDIICVGDSYTFGSETSDFTTYPAVLQNMLGLKVANFGVFAFDPIQSVLQYEELLTRMDPPTIGILGIMYENGRRNLNSFRPVYFNHFDPVGAFFFKPFFDGNRVIDPIIKTNNTFENYKRQAQEVFTRDFWVKPRLSFPFSLSLVQALNSNYFEFHFYQKLNHLRGRGTFAHDYNSQIILDSIRYSVNRFVSVSMRHDIFPIVIFIPMDSKDLTSPDLIIQELREVHPQARILNFGRHEMDWSEYTPGEGFHPTAQGYAEIAEFLYSLIVDEGLIIMDSIVNHVENKH